MNIDEFIASITDSRHEENNLLKFMRSLHLSPLHRILDVGCGYGSKMKLLGSCGFNVVGVDVNQKMIASNIEQGMNCMSIHHFGQTEDLFDVLLMSHIIEHFQPGDLIKFMDGYLDRLKTGGYLIISTPLSSSYFYEDFDHIKPYHPTGINMVFGNQSAQVQYYSRNKLELRDIWFRKGPFKNVFARRLYSNKYSRGPILFNFVMAVLFRFSFGLIGRTDGWMGLYRKTSS